MLYTLSVIEHFLLFISVIFVDLEVQKNHRISRVY